MAVHRTIETTSIDKLNLDSKNPRLGRQAVKKNLTQDAVLKIMRRFTLDEIGISILKSGFWPQEALIAIKEKDGKSEKLTVVEGNRRLAALKLLQQAQDDDALKNGKRSTMAIQKKSSVLSPTC